MIEQFDGQYAFLSNFYAAPIIDRQGVRWWTSEHAYQACKTVDPVEKRAFLSSSDPRIAKRMGRRVTVRPGWENIKVTIMTKIVTAKFEQHPDLMALLKQTGDTELIEGNYWHDNFWGDCACPKCQVRPGENHLGKILMSIRNM